MEGEKKAQDHDVPCNYSFSPQKKEERDLTPYNVHKTCRSVTNSCALHTTTVMGTHEWDEHSCTAPGTPQGTTTSCLHVAMAFWCRLSPIDKMPFLCVACISRDLRSLVLAKPCTCTGPSLLSHDCRKMHFPDMMNFNHIHVHHSPRTSSRERGNCGAANEQ